MAGQTVFFYLTDVSKHEKTNPPFALFNTALVRAYVILTLPFLANTRNLATFGFGLK